MMAARALKNRGGSESGRRTTRSTTRGSRFEESRKYSIPSHEFYHFQVLNG